jgi:peptide-methionine (S)-S-oxide reductase
MTTQTLETAVFANGCFWCTEAVFAKLKGVISVEPGYTGGTVPNPTYDAVCGGTTGHAEAIRIVFDPAQIAFDDLLAVFFNTHDPTTRNRQGNDVGTQYRSAIFYTTPEQQEKARALIHELDAAKAYEKPVVTEVEALSTFYPAEDYHKNYYAHHSEQAYCALIIAPKLEKLEKKFAALIK